METNAREINQRVPPLRHPWVVTFAALATNLVLGVLYAWSVMGKALDQQWHWSKAQTALPFTVATACFAVTMIFAGRLQDTIGPRLVVMLGGWTLGAGLASSSLVHTPTGMVLTFGVLAGVGIGLGYSATTPPAIKWFPAERKGVITGIVVSGVGMAAVYISPLTQHLLKTTTIERTFLWLGIGAAVLVTLFAQLLSNPPENHWPQVSADEAEPGPRPSGFNIGFDWHEMLRTPQFYLLWLTFVMGGAAGLMIIAHVAVIASEQADWKRGFVPVAILAVFNTLGRIISGAVSDRVGRSQTLVAAFFLQALNMFAFSHYTTPAWLVVGSAWTGLCYGTLFTLMPAGIADRYGTKNLGVNYGLLFTAFGVAGVVGPTLGGSLRDEFGSWTYSFNLSAALLVLGGALTLALRVVERKRSPRTAPPVRTSAT